MAKLLIDESCTAKNCKRENSLLKYFGVGLGRKKEKKMLDTMRGR